VLVTDGEAVDFHPENSRLESRQDTNSSEIFCSFPQSFKINSGIVSRLGHDHFVYTLIQFMVSSNAMRVLPSY
jgi:hypothetical protein